MAARSSEDGGQAANHGREGQPPRATLNRNNLIPSQYHGKRIPVMVEDVLAEDEQSTQWIYFVKKISDADTEYFTSSVKDKRRGEGGSSNKKRKGGSSSKREGKGSSSKDGGGGSSSKKREGGSSSKKLQGGSSSKDGGGGGEAPTESDSGDSSPERSPRARRRCDVAIGHYDETNEGDLRKNDQDKMFRKLANLSKLFKTRFVNMSRDHMHEAALDFLLDEGMVSIGKSEIPDSGNGLFAEIEFQAGDVIAVLTSGVMDEQIGDDTKFKNFQGMKYNRKNKRFQGYAAQTCCRMHMQKGCSKNCKKADKNPQHVCVSHCPRIPSEGKEDEPCPGNAEFRVIHALSENNEKTAWVVLIALHKIKPGDEVTCYYPIATRREKELAALQDSDDQSERGRVDETRYSELDSSSLSDPSSGKSGDENKRPGDNEDEDEVEQEHKVEEEEEDEVEREDEVEEEDEVEGEDEVEEEDGDDDDEEDDDDDEDDDEADDEDEEEDEDEDKDDEEDRRRPHKRRKAKRDGVSRSRRS